MTAQWELDGSVLIVTDDDGDQLDLRPAAEAPHFAIATAGIGVWLEEPDLEQIRIWIDRQIGPPRLLAAAEHLIEDLINAKGDPVAADAALARFVTATPV